MNQQKVSIIFGYNNLKKKYDKLILKVMYRKFGDLKKFSYIIV